MNFTAGLVDGLWAALFAMSMAVIFSAPFQGLIPSFCGGFGADRPAIAVGVSTGVLIMRSVRHEAAQ